MVRNRNNIGSKTEHTPNFDFIVVTATNKQRARRMDCYSSDRTYSAKHKSSRYNAARHEQILVHEAMELAFVLIEAIDKCTHLVVP